MTLHETALDARILRSGNGLIIGKLLIAATSRSQMLSICLAKSLFVPIGNSVRPFKQVLPERHATWF